MTNRERESIKELIAAKERTLSRTGDEWLKRVVREDISSLYRQLSEDRKK